jgi:hypothetical protein
MFSVARIGSENINSSIFEWWFAVLEEDRKGYGFPRELALRVGEALGWR